ncbi:MAG: hypothetical protein Q8O89_03020 [Nanoarchaeota archaeon]|nr:hypothetical protein [Nanoarchaeota archaeon]
MKKSVSKKGRKDKIRNIKQKNAKSYTLRKYHLNVISANLFAMTLAIFFIRSYVSRGFSIWPVFLGLCAITAVFILLVVLVLKPRGKVKTLFPHRNLLIINFSISIIMSLIYIRQIGLLGFFFIIIFSFLLFDIEHVIYDNLQKAWADRRGSKLKGRVKK